MVATRVGIIGNGHLGKFLYEELGKREEFVVIRVWNRTSSEGILPLEGITPQNLQDLDLVVEVAHPAILAQYIDVILENTNLFIGSPTCLANQLIMDKIEAHLKTNLNRKVFVPAGAFWGGNDVQKMAEKGLLKSLTVTMTKHPNSFKLEDPLKGANEKAKSLTEPTVLYEGSVRGLCPLAPNNVNTMAGAAVAAQNLGFDGVKARLVSDPSLIDWHIVEVLAEGPDGFQVHTIRKNPAKPGAVTGQLTYFSFLSSIQETLHKPSGLQIC
ncbi:unnamed protein product, partial [Mesorhabditis belari]|uniref:Aspartate dehydrogenase domain-containing protein n=1 Tax=Mesorhabditis belari TaxID=2138241 RepID=A0AAF3E995_9BILA